MTTEDLIINRLSKKYGMPKEVIKAIVESQFEFTRHMIKEVDVNLINEKEDLDTQKSTFRFMGLGSLHVDIKKVKAIKKNIKK